MGLVALSLADGGYYPRALAIAALVVWWALLAPLVFGLWPRDRLSRPAIWAGWLWCGLAALTAASIGWATDPGIAHAEAVRAAGYAGLFVLTIVAGRRGEAGAWIAGLVTGAAVVGLLALAGRLQPSLFSTGAAELASELPAARSRISFPIGYWNGLAAVIAAGIVLLAWQSANGFSRIVRAGATALIAPLALALFLTSSRGGALAVLAGLAVVVAVGPRRSWSVAALVPALIAAGVLIALANSYDALGAGLADSEAARQGDLLTVACVFAIAAVAVVAWFADGLLSRIALPRRAGWILLGLVAVVAVVAVVAADPVSRIDQFRQPPAVDGSDPIAGLSHLTSDAGNGRWQFWSAAIDAFASEPIHGIGAGSYQFWWNQEGTIEMVVRDAHSWPLETLAELGLLGGLIALGAIVASLAAVPRRLRSRRRDRAAVGAALAVLATGLLASAIDWTWELPAVLAYVVIAMGLLCGPQTAPRPAGSVEGPAGGSTTRFASGIALILFGLVAIWGATTLLVAEGRLDASREAANDGRLEDAAQAAADADTIVPWSAEPVLQLALVREAAGDLEGARAALDDAIDRSPEDWRLWVVAARLDVLSGNVERAREELDEALRLNPKATFLKVASGDQG